MTSRTTALGAADQTTLPIFRVLLGVQVLATIMFGVIPLALPATFASIAAYSGDDPYIYRLAGAATAGYLIAALVGLAGRRRWADLRIPIAGTLTFTAAAAVGSVATIVGGDGHWVVFVVLLAAVGFAGFAGYWLRRDQGAPVVGGPGLDQASRIIIGLATLSAAVFGLLPLVIPAIFASVFGLVGTDVWMFRMAGSACLGYAVAGLLELRATGYQPIAIQNLAAIAFNAFAAVASWLSVASGTGGILAPVVAVAATFFALALGWLAVRDR
jgi:hypothetical protein